MALSVLSDASAAIDSRTLTWTILTLAIGDVVVVTVVTWDQPNTMNVPSGTGLSFTQRVAANAASKVRVYQWTAVASSGGSNVVVTSSVLAGGNSIHNGTLTLCPTADGYSLAGSPNVLSNAAAGTTPSGALAGVSGSLGIVALGDWNAVDGASRAWLVSAAEDLYQFSGGNSTQYIAHCTLTGASTTVGLSAPTAGTNYSIGAIEVLKSAGGAAARTKAKVYNRAAIVRASTF